MLKTKDVFTFVLNDAFGIAFRVFSSLLEEVSSDNLHLLQHAFQMINSQQSFTSYFQAHLGSCLLWAPCVCCTCQLGRLVLRSEQNIQYSLCLNTKLWDCKWCNTSSSSVFLCISKLSVLSEALVFTRHSQGISKTAMMTQCSASAQKALIFKRGYWEI